MAIETAPAAKLPEKRPVFTAHLAGFAAAYLAAVVFGLWFVIPPEGLAPIWPASGVALAAMLLSPRRAWPAILGIVFSMNLLADLVIGYSGWVSLGFALANTLETALGGWLMVRLAGPKVTFTQLSDAAALLGVAALANALTAVPGAITARLAFDAPFLYTWVVWWIEDMLGILLLTPLIVLWARGASLRDTYSPARLMEAVLLAASITGASWAVFGQSPVWAYAELRPHLLFPLLGWAALRFSPRGTMTVLLIVAIIALSSSVAGTSYYPLGGATTGARVAAVQAYLVVASLSALFLSLIVTERQRASLALGTALAEKETLLRELYHRTKNNMQVIIALLELQSNEFDEPRLKAAFGEARHRIQAMALVHQKLYQSQNLSSIDLGAYLQDLVRLVQQSYGPAIQRVRFTTRVAVIPVSIDTAIPCGMAVNEILTNVMKHAFPGGRSGQVHLSLAGGEDQQVRIEIADNGAGLPPGLDPRRSETLGMQTIFNLIEHQLGGRVTLVNDGGLHWLIEFTGDR